MSQRVSGTSEWSGFESIGRRTGLACWIAVPERKGEGLTGLDLLALTRGLAQGATFGSFRLRVTQYA